MDRTKRKRLEAAGWRVGSAEEFLGLTEEEAAFVDLKLALSTELRDRRLELGLSQVDLAKRLGSSQSRVAKMEASERSVSVDLLIRGLLPRERPGKRLQARFRNVRAVRVTGGRPGGPTSDNIGLASYVS